MKFTARVRDTVTGDEWEEKWDEPFTTEEQARKFVDKACATFNATLRPAHGAIPARFDGWLHHPAIPANPEAEHPRAVISVIVTDSRGTEHRWIKTNLFMQQHAGKTFDGFKCSTCGIIGSSSGLAEPRPLRRYTSRSRDFWRCDTAQIYLGRMSKRARDRLVSR